MKHSTRKPPSRKPPTKKIGYVIAENRQAQLLLESGVVLAFLAEILRQFGVVFQQWALDDELVLTVAKRPIPQARLEKELNADEQHRRLRQFPWSGGGPASQSSAA